MKNSKEETIVMKNIPYEEIRKASANVSNYTVAFLRPTENLSIPPSVLGTGVLVSVKGKRIILTANHLTDEIAIHGATMMALSPGQQSLIPLVQVTEIFPIGKPSENKKEPDLSFFILPPETMRSIAAQKSFFNLGKHRDLSLDRANLGIAELSRHSYFVQGHPGEQSRFNEETQMLTFFNYNFITGPEEPDSYIPADESGYDYLVLPAKEEEYSERIDGPPSSGKPPLSSWGGMSGGGVWLTSPRRKDDKIEFAPPVLFGICFWEFRDENGKIICVKTHGPVSLYRMLYREVQDMDLPA